MANTASAKGFAVVETGRAGASEEIIGAPCGFDLGGLTGTGLLAVEVKLEAVVLEFLTRIAPHQDRAEPFLRLEL